jgi:hypothetical protein
MDKEYAWKAMVAAMRVLLGDEDNFVQGRHFVGGTFFFHNATSEELEIVCQLLAEQFNQWNYYHRRDICIDVSD